MIDNRYKCLFDSKQVATEFRTDDAWGKFEVTYT